MLRSETSKAIDCFDGDVTKTVPVVYMNLYIDKDEST